MDLINAYEEHKTTPEHRDAVQRSQKQQESQKRLSNEIWWAQYDYTKGKSLAAPVRDEVVKFDDLNSWDRDLVEAFESRRSAKALDRLLAQKRPPYRGAGAAIALSLSCTIFRGLPGW